MTTDSITRRCAMATVAIASLTAATTLIGADQVGRLAYVREQQFRSQQVIVQIGSDEPIAWQLEPTAPTAASQAGSVTAKVYGLDVSAPETTWVLSVGRLTLTSLPGSNARLVFTPASPSKVTIRVGPTANVLEIVVPVAATP